jgi:hypothetical protein
MAVSFFVSQTNLHTFPQAGRVMSRQNSSATATACKVQSTAKVINGPRSCCEFMLRLLLKRAAPGSAGGSTSCRSSSIVIVLQNSRQSWGCHLVSHRTASLAVALPTNQLANEHRRCWRLMLARPRQRNSQFRVRSRSTYATRDSATNPSRWRRCC